MNFPAIYDRDNKKKFIMISKFIDLCRKRKAWALAAQLNHSIIYED